MLRATVSDDLKKTLDTIDHEVLSSAKQTEGILIV